MIKYSLICGNDHEFEGWFSNSASFENEQTEGRLSCPYCGSHDVGKALMAPNVKTTKGRELTSPQQAAMMDVASPQFPDGAPEAIREAMNKVREYVETHADNVGDNFAEEARKIHYEETEPRGIYGNATLEEVKDLHDEGIDALPLPPSPRKQN